jgi:DNA repair protein RadC
MTAQLRDGLALLDIRLLDHLVIAGSQVTSMAERGMI